MNGSEAEAGAWLVPPALSAEDEARLDRWGRQVGLEMLYGNWERAHALVEGGRRELTLPGPANVTATPLADCVEERLAHAFRGWQTAVEEAARRKV